MYLVTDSEGYTIGVFVDYTLACEALLDYAGQVLDGHYLADYPPRDVEPGEVLLPITYVTEGTDQYGNENPAGTVPGGWHIIEILQTDTVA